MLKPYDIIESDAFQRFVIGVRIDPQHKCLYHYMPCKMLVYELSSTNTSKHYPNNAFMYPSDWCQLTLEGNGYKPTGEVITLSCKCRKFTHLYVLRLVDGKYYVGITSRPEDRIAEHKEGRGAKWTKRFPVINVELLQAFDKPIPECKAVELETLKTIELCTLYGYENVSGADLKPQCDGK